MSGRGLVRKGSHGAAIAGLFCSLFLPFASACSGPTDIVGVIDEEPSAEQPASDATALPPTTPRADTPDDSAADASDVALLLAGRPMTDWSGEALEWPLSMPLGELFASSRSERDQPMPAPWLARRVASFARSSSRGTRDLNARSSEFDARLLILDEEDARQLLAMMTAGGGPGGERAAVFRDALGDVYRVSLESDEMPLDGVGCDGRMRREPFECAGRGPFD